MPRFHGSLRETVRWYGMARCLRPSVHPIGELSIEGMIYDAIIAAGNRGAGFIVWFNPLTTCAVAENIY